MVWTYCLCEKVFPRYKLVLRDLLSLICRLFEDNTISGLLAMRFPTPLCFLKYSEIPPFKPYTGLHWSIYRSGWQWRAGLCVLYRLCAHALVGVKWYAVFCWCQSKCVRVRERGRWEIVSSLWVDHQSTNYIDGRRCGQVEVSAGVWHILVIVSGLIGQSGIFPWKPLDSYRNRWPKWCGCFFEVTFECVCSWGAGLSRWKFWRDTELRFLCNECGRGL